MSRTRTLRIALACPSIAVLMLVGLGTGQATAAPTSPPARIQPAAPPPARPSARPVGGPHIMPKLRPGARPNSAPPGAHLTYYGGRVISNVQVQQVLWGSGSYEPEVSRTSSPSIATFYQGVTNSPYVDWLTEYNTAGFPAPTSNQTIGRGGFGQQVTITPSGPGATGTTVDDTAIQSEIVAQLNAGHLPAPTFDAAGNDNTLYALYFPHGIVITQGGGSSGVTFCAYHGTITYNSHSIYYLIMPDFGPGSGNDTGCGSSPTEFGNVTSVSSHELVETMTDAEVGLATILGPPLAWYDQVNGEIGDICNAQQGSVVGSDGVTYTVQTQFSNVANNCIVSRPVSNDFSVSLTPGSQVIAPGSSVTFTVDTATSSGSAQTISLSVSGLPAGVTGTLSPASVTSGQSSTLTLTAASSAAAGTTTFTVTGTATSGSHAATAPITVPGSSGGIVNGDFEAGSLTGWTVAGSASVMTSGTHSGSFAAQVGSTNPSTDSSISQDFTAAANSTTLSLWYQVHCPDTVTYDWAVAVLTDHTVGTSTTVVPKTCITGPWTNATTSVTPGHSYTLTLANHDDNYPADPTYTLYDDVVINVNAPPPGGIANGGFEAGLTGWTSAGTAAAVTSPVHSGSHAAQLGSPSSPTNGDSTLAQTFIAPANSTILSFWYRMTCPDTVTYDWATATLTDNSVAVTTTPLAKVCSTDSSFHQVTTAVTSGHSYTLTLASHDDNYSADPSATWYDDVTLPGTTTSTLVLSPATAQVTAGSGQTYAAQLVDGSGNVLQDVTGATSFTISPDGSCSVATCTPVHTGGHTVSGLYKGVTATAVLTATVGPVASLQVVPATATITAGGSQPYQIEGFDASGNDVGDVTAATALTIGPDGACTTGSCAAQVAGIHTVSASDGTATGTATLTVIAGPLAKLTLTPATATISAGGSQPYQVEAFDAYGNDLGDATPATALALGPDGSCGIGSCTAHIAGAHTVTATDGTVVTSGTLQVNAGNLSALTVSPASASAPAGAPQPFTAEGFDAYGNDLGDVTAATQFAISPDGSCSANICRAFVVGPHTIMAADSPAANIASFTVTTASTTVTVGSDLPTAARNQPVTLTAAVLPNAPATGAPTGTVTFLDGTKTIGSAHVLNSAASIMLSALALGTHSLSASYGGDGNYGAATAAPFTQLVVRRPVTVTIASPPSGSYGSTIPLSATVTDTISGAPVAGDEVTFRVGGQAVEAVTNAAGTAATTLRLSIAPGDWSLSATVKPVRSEATGGAGQPLSVTPELATLALTGDPLVMTSSAATTSAPVPISARLTQASGAAGDPSRARVTLLIYQAADTALAHPIQIGPLSPGSPAPDGTVTFSTSRTLGVGVYLVRAVIAANNRYFQGASDFGTVVVARPLAGPRVDGAGAVTDPATFGETQPTSATDTGAAFALSAHGQATPTGTALYTFADNAGRLDIVQMTVSSLKVTKPGLAVLAGPVTITTLDPVTGHVSTVGGYTGSITVNDGGAGQPDSFAITILDPASNLWHQAGTATTPLAVLPDSIIVTTKS